jgi:uncharacterized OsmC-like protein
MTAPSTDLREYDVRAGSTATPGRVMCSVRNHHIVVDGPVQNGFAGEEITPAELFLAAVAACGVELIQMLAKQQDAPLEAIDVDIKGLLDRSRPARTDYTVFNAVQLQFRLQGVTEEQGTQLVEAFKRR